MRNIILFILFLAVPFLITAESLPIEQQIDDFFSQKTADNIPTLSEIRDLKQQADKSFSEKNYEQAVLLYEKHFEIANFVANIIDIGIQPYLSADRTSRNAFAFSNEDKINADIQLSNSLKKERNVSILRQGICYYYLNEKEKAIISFSKALNLIGIFNYDEWNEARRYLYFMIDYNSYESFSL